MRRVRFCNQACNASERSRRKQSSPSRIKAFQSSGATLPVDWLPLAFYVVLAMTIASIVLAAWALMRG
jgi:hypothetical protein